MFTLLTTARRPRRLSALALLLPLIMAANPLAEVASNVTHTRGNAEFNQRSTFEVDPVTFALNIEIPLADYPGRGPDVSATLRYSSKVWRGESGGHFFPQNDPDGDPIYKVWPLYSEFSFSGWNSSLGVPIIESSASSEAYVAWGNGQCVLGNVTGEAFDGALTEPFYACGEPTCPTNPFAYYIDRLRVIMPDGSSHAMRRSNNAYPSPRGGSGHYLAEDGSGLRYDVSTQTLLLSDGSRYLLAVPGGMKYIDSNGNTLTHNPSTGQWTDTLERSYNRPPLPGAVGVGSHSWTLPKVGGGASTYILRTSTLGDARSNPDDPLRFMGETYFDLQHNQHLVSPNLFNSIASAQPPFLNNLMLSDSSPFNPVVLKELELPNGHKYEFWYNVYGEIDKVVLPTGGVKRYRYDYVPSGQPNPTVYSQTNRGVVEMCESADSNKCQTASSSGPGEAHWQFSVGSTSLYELRIVTAPMPDGTRTERYLRPTNTGPDPFGVFSNDPTAGRPVEERVYDAGNHLIRRTINVWGARGPTGQQNVTLCTNPILNVGGLLRDPHLTRQTEIMFDTGGDPLSQTTTYEYDADLNVTIKKIYGYQPVSAAAAQTDVLLPLGTLLRTEESTYLVNDASVAQTTRDAYRARNLIRLLTSTLVRDGAGTIVARSTTTYDESTYPLLTYAGQVTGWTDPGANIRGNATTSREWLNPGDSWVETHAQYDQFGNERNTWDAHAQPAADDPSPVHGNQSRAFFSDSFSGGGSGGGVNTYAYATRTETPAPDPSGQHGSTTALVTTSVYDFQTGLVTSATDANNQTTTFQYNDPLDRRTAEIRPPGAGRTDYEYSDDPGNIFVRTLTDLDATRRAEVKQYFDRLGRPYRTQTFENQLPDRAWITTDLQYDVLGRVVRKSFPYRASGGAAPLEETQEGWLGKKRSETGYDALGRVLTITTLPDNAAVKTDYGGDRVLVTDQANKQRISRTDALGRLVEVWEVGPSEPSSGTEAVTFPSRPGVPTVAAGYRTTYTHDALGNLKTVKQGAQERTFIYDSLSRLRSATNPENGTITYQYDADGNLLVKTDARGVSTHVSYDAMNRAVRKWYNGSSALTATTNNSPALPGGVGASNEATFKYDCQGALAADCTNGRGSLWRTSDGTHTTELLKRDAAGRPRLRRQWFGQSPYEVKYLYNLDGTIGKQDYPSDHSATYSYDLVGRLDSTSGNLGDGRPRAYSSGIKYDELGGMSREQFGTQTPLYHRRRYNARGQLYDIRLGTADDGESWNRGQLVSHYGSGDFTQWGTSGADNNGNVLRTHHIIPDAQGNLQALHYQDYVYDALNRLTRVTESTSGQPSAQYVQQYVYDRWGNRTIDGASTSGGVPEPGFDARDLPQTNRLYAPGDLDPGKTEAQRLMRYDVAGNLTQDYCDETRATGVCARSFDAENRLAAAQFVDGQVQIASYTYDVDGRRVRRKAGVAAEVWQVYGAGGELLAEYAAGAAPSSPRKEYGYRSGELLITAEPAAAPAPQPVTWQNPAGVTASANNLTKNGAASWDAGASSTQSIASGDGYIEFTAGNVSDRMCGLSQGDSSQHYNDIDFAIYPNSGNYVDVYEGGTLKWGGVVQYQPGDRFRVAVEGGVIKYYKVGAGGALSHLYTSSVSPQYPLLADTSLYTTGAQVTNVTIVGGGGQGAPTNLSQGKPATQSSTGWGGVASRAVDGNTSGAWADGSVSHTDYESQPWWQVDLQSVQQIGRVDFWLMTECCSAHADFDVKVSDDGATWASYYVAGPLDSGGVDANRTGRYVRVQLRGTEHLALAEVKVWSAAGGGSAPVAFGNAGFETPTLGHGAYSYNPSGGAWAFAGASGITANASGFTSGNPAAPEGAQVAFLQGGNWSHLSQQVTGLQAGASYTVTFKAAQRGNHSQGGQDFDLSVDGQTVGTYRPAGTSYEQLSATFTAASGAQVLKFVGRNTAGGDNTAFIDDVKVSPAPAGGGAVKWLVGDHLGTPRMVVNESGGLPDVSRHDYLPFGEELQAGAGQRSTAQGYSKGDKVRQRFTGKERDDETGMDYFLARYYASAQGRFTSPDEFNGGPDELFEFIYAASANPTFYADPISPQSFNKYQYCLNNPLKFIDPDGHQEYAPHQDVEWQRAEFEARTDVVKGVRNAVANTVIDITNLTKSYIRPREALTQRYEPENVTQGISQVVVEDLITFGGLLSGRGQTSAVMAEGKGTSAVTAQVGRMRANMSAGDKGFTTYAAAQVKTAGGKTEMWVSSAGKSGYVRPKIRGDARNVRSPAKPQHSNIKNVNDAERHIVRTARREGARINAIGATRKACNSCRNAIRKSGKGTKIVDP